MSDPVNDFVNVSITIDSAGPAQPGFGVLAILTHDAPFTDRVRYYGATSEAVTDGFASDHPVYRALARIFAQEIKPDRVAVVLTSTDVTQSYTVGVASVEDETEYAINVAGQGFADTAVTYTSDASATNDEITAGLVTALNAVASRSYTAASIGSPGSTKIKLIADEALVFADQTFTADAATDKIAITGHGLTTGAGPFQATNSGGALPAGLAVSTDYWWIRVDADHGKLATSRANAIAGTAIDISGAGTGTHTLSDTASTRSLLPNSWFSVEVTSRRLLSNVQDHAAPSGLSTDLDEILLVEDDWFGLVSLFNSAAYALVLATWLDANSRIGLVDTCDSESETTSASVGTDLAKQVNDAGGYGLACVYHPSPANFVAAASLGRWLATDPGASVMHLKTLAGVSAVALSTGARANLAARYCSAYYRAAGIGVYNDAGVPSRTYRFLDVVRNRYWLQSRIRTEVFGLQQGAEVIPFTRGGVQRIGGKVRAVMQGEAVTEGVLAGGADLAVVSLPDVDDTSQVTATDREDRNLRNITASGILQGAVYSTAIRISLSF